MGCWCAPGQYLGRGDVLPAEPFADDAALLHLEALASPPPASALPASASELPPPASASPPPASALPPPASALPPPASDPEPKSRQVPVVEQ